MTTETMNIHQALVELKTLEKRIETAVKEGEWVMPISEYVVVGYSTGQGGSKSYTRKQQRYGK